MTRAILVQKGANAGLIPRSCTGSFIPCSRYTTHRGLGHRWHARMPVEVMAVHLPGTISRHGILLTFFVTGTYAAAVALRSVDRCRIQTLGHILCWIGLDVTTIRSHVDRRQPAGGGGARAVHGGRRPARGGRDGGAHEPDQSEYATSGRLSATSLLSAPTLPFDL